MRCNVINIFIIIDFVESLIEQTCLKMRQMLEMRRPRIKTQSITHRRREIDGGDSGWVGWCVIASPSRSVSALICVHLRLFFHTEPQIHADERRFVARGSARQLPSAQQTKDTIKYQ